MSNKITKEQLDALIDAAVVEEHLFHGGKSMILSYQLESGFTIDGRAAVVDLNNFDIEIGRQVAREDAINQLWQLEGYRLQLELAKV